MKGRNLKKDQKWGITWVSSHAMNEHANRGFIPRATPVSQKSNQIRGRFNTLLNNAIASCCSTQLVQISSNNYYNQLLK